MRRRTGPRIAVISGIFTLVIAGAGLIGMLVLNAFVLDKFNQYGEVPIPGLSTVHLPAGEVTASFHTVVLGGSRGGLTVPNLHLSIVSKADLPLTTVTADFGTATTVNNDARVRVWVVQVPVEGDYEVTTSGDVGGYINPRLAFGHGSPYGWVTWLFAAFLAAGILELAVALFWSARSAKRARPLEQHEMASWSSAPPPTASAGGGFAPSDQGVRLEQIRQLAALRDSGALTEDEYTAEKRRVLDSQ